jgi:hypothetical protein
MLLVFQLVHVENTSSSQASARDFYKDYNEPSKALRPKVVDRLAYEFRSVSLADFVVCGYQ